MLALGAIAGPPISGAIADSTGDYKGVGIFAGKIIPSFDTYASII